MKKIKSTLTLTLILVMCVTVLAGCGSSGSSASSEEGDSGVIIVANSPDEVEVSTEDLEPLAEPTDFTFDFENMTYAFTGAEEAEFYYIRVYPVIDGEEGNSASFQSDKIDADASNSYEGTIDNEILLAGDYNAYVVASASGYSSSETETSGISTLLAEPSVEASWNTDEDSGEVTAQITITPMDELTSSFTVTVVNELGEEVYRNADAGVEPIVLTAADLGAEVLSTEDVYTVNVEDNPVSGYRVPTEPATAEITEPMMFMPF